MAFGYTGTYVAPATGEAISFEGPYQDWEKAVGSLPDGSIQQIQLYDHGAPGEIGGQNAEHLAAHLGPKMAAGGTVDISGCNTAGFVPSNYWNPLQGVNSLAAMILYNGLPRLMGDDDLAEMGWQNLASDLSRRLPGVYVSGLSGFGFPLSRLPGQLGLDVEGHAPSALAASRRLYLNGKECASAEQCAAAGEAGSSSGEAATDGVGAQSELSSEIGAPKATSVTADDKKIAHRGSCHLAKTRGATDVCWAGGDDSPAAFENTGYMSALVDATTHTFVDDNPVWIKPARLRTSMNPHPAKPIGLSSSQPHMNEVRAIECSKDVIFEGQGVVCTDHQTTQNKKNTTGAVTEKPAVAHPAALTDSAIVQEAKAFLKWANEKDREYKGRIDLTKDPRELLRADPLLRRKWYDYEQQKERDKLGKTSLEILSNGIQRARWVHLPLETGKTWHELWLEQIKDRRSELPIVGLPAVSELGKDIAVMSHGYETAGQFMLRAAPGGSYVVDNRFEPYQFGHRSDTGYKREYWDLEGAHEDQNHHLDFFLSNALMGIGAGGMDPFSNVRWNAFGAIHDPFNKPDRELAYAAPALTREVANPANSNADVNDYIWSTFGDPTYVDEDAEAAKYEGPWCETQPGKCPAKLDEPVLPPELSGWNTNDIPFGP